MLAVVEIDGRDQFWCTADISSGGGGGVSWAGNGERVGEERARTAREGRDDVADSRRAGGRPCGVAKVGPETFLGREGAKLGGCGGGGGKGGAVEKREDVSLNDVGMYGGEGGGTAFVDGGDRRGN